MNAKQKREETIRRAKSSLILDAGRVVFSDKGYHETRLEDIAEKAGFSKASLYNYFADKEEIFLSLAIREYDHVVSDIEHRVDPSASLVENLRAVVSLLFSYFGEHFAFLLTTSNYQTAWLLHGELCKHEQLISEFRHSMERIVSVFIRIIASGRERGEVTSSLDNTTIARFLTALIKSVMFHWKLEETMGDTEKACEDILAFALNGIGHSSGNKVI